jgi:hypothetical protein
MIPRVLQALALILLLLIYGLAGQSDYADARRFECADHGRGYDEATDRCASPNQPKA